MKIRVDLKLTGKQQESYDLLHRDDVTHLVCRFSRQCGKSVLAEILLIEFLCKPRAFNVYISPTFSQGRKVFKEIKALLKPTGLLSTANASTLTIETKFGSQLQFFSMENPTAIRGYTVRGLCVLDECAFFPDQTSDGDDPWSSIIMPTLKANKKLNKVLAISTPKGKRGLFWSFHNKVLQGLQGWRETSATIYDDQLVTPDEIEEIKSQISYTAFEEEFLVKFLDSSLSFFTGYEKCFKALKFLYGKKNWAGVDFSANGKDETIVTIINSNDEVKSIEVTGTLDEKYRKIADIIDSIPNLQKCLMENNGVGAPMINEVKKLLVKNKNKVEEFLTTNKSKVEILSLLAVKISKEEIIFNEEDVKLKSQFSTFITHYTKKGNLQLEASAGAHDDKIMSLAIANKSKNDSNVMGQYNLSFLRR